MPAEENKPFYMSKTLWVNLIAVVMTVVASYTGEEMDPQAQIGLLALVNMVLRMVTKQKLTT